YFVGSAYTLRTPANQAQTYNFAGDSLTVAGQFWFKMTNVITVADLRLTNGIVVNQNAGGNPNMGRLAGNLEVITNGVLEAGGSLSVGNGPGGVLRVGYRNSSGAGAKCIAVLDVSSQPLFTANVGEFSVGNNQANDSYTTVGYAYLATNNHVTATNVLIADSSF